MPQDYNKTINLPKTDFPMRAGLPKREPEMLQRQSGMALYNAVMERNEGKPLYVLHDGPPYANGDIHMGHALDKALKDFVVRYKNMTGYKAPYIPGWDTHGLPIESQIIKQLGLDRHKMSVAEFRDHCHKFAMDYVERQREQFMRLGGIADWFSPYLTLSPDFEAEQIRVFGQMAQKGYIYKGLRPVYWCCHDETALAEAEIEYQEDPCKSVYVKFRMKDDLGKLGQYGDLSKMHFVIWTTTTWTLPGNLAISLGPDFDYVLLRAGDETYIVAEALAGALIDVANLEKTEILATLKGSEFERMTARHPFLDRDSLIIVGDHVTLESGTGCVHTAPGHGAEDFAVCRSYDLEVIVPVDAYGRMTEEAGPFAGLTTDEANAAIFEQMKASGALLASQNITHTYPHCWRCKEPVLFRATEQWFASVESFKDEAVKAARSVSWSPAWGEERLVSMIQDRADWCVSRQRNWGVPIPIFYCEQCGHEHITPESIEAVASLFEKEGSNAWYLHDASEILPAGTKCAQCGHDRFTKETDIMDVWFDSGSSHAAVMEKRCGYWPADLYSEGADQYRGWFQSSLLTAVATRGAAPYKQVISHGMVVDGEGKKMSKSIGNTIDPLDVFEKYGADILRLWVSSCDYRVDMRISNDIFKQLSDIYLKIRNTARYILGNLDGFDLSALVPVEQLPELDRWALHRLNLLVEKVRAAYEAFEFHVVYHVVHNFCVIEMSNFYLDVIKDRLYCEGRDSAERRSAQTAIYHILSALVRMLAPILAFTTDEIWQAMPHPDGTDTRSAVLSDMPEVREAWRMDEQSAERWDRLLLLRADVNRALELARAERLIGKPLEAKVTLYAQGESYDLIASFARELSALLIVSEVDIQKGEDKGVKGENLEGLTVLVERVGHEKCARCWMHLESVGTDEEHPELCARCAGVVRAL